MKFNVDKEDSLFTNRTPTLLRTSCIEQCRVLQLEGLRFRYRGVHTKLLTESS